MTKQESGSNRRSSRARKHKEMLEAALARPGVREIMKLYGSWQEKDRGLDAYRSATRETNKVTTTDSSNAW